jgi:hypothetical protein
MNRVLKYRCYRLYLKKYYQRLDYSLWATEMNANEKKQKFLTKAYKQNCYTYLLLVT